MNEKRLGEGWLAKQLAKSEASVRAWPHRKKVASGVIPVLEALDRLKDREPTTKKEIC